MIMRIDNKTLAFSALCATIGSLGIGLFISLGIHADKKRQAAELYCVSSDALIAKVEPFGTVCVKRQHLIYIPEKSK